ncbi:MAG: hypothetical protein Q8784_01640 [Vigna little leaf phytoplasma]|nr:hypothetical protein [Vigna little leaf phytoplasma]
MFKLAKKRFLFLFSILFLINNNHQIVAMNTSSLSNEEIQEIKADEEIENTISIQKFCALHEIGHAVVAYELSKRHGKYLIDLIQITLISNNQTIADGTTEFIFDKEDSFGNLLALSAFFGGLEAEKTLQYQLPTFKYRGQHDEQDIEKTEQHIIAKRWFLEDFYLPTDSLEIRINKIKIIATKKQKK